MDELIKVQKLGGDLIIVLPKEISDRLDIKEGTEVEMETFICSNKPGIRIILKTD